MVSAKLCPLIIYFFNTQNGRYQLQCGPDLVVFDTRQGTFYGLTKGEWVIINPKTGDVLRREITKK
jgi:hypothetical protein